MAEVHVERLRRLVVCPLCECGMYRTIEDRDRSRFIRKFVCGATFEARIDGDAEIRATGFCGARTELAAEFLNKECKGAAP